MQVEDRILRNVVYLGTFQEDKFIPKATAFFCGVTIGAFGFIHLVTAEHVIDGFRRLGRDVAHIRMNTSGGSVLVIESKLSDWLTHPDSSHVRTDVAVIPIDLKNAPVQWLAADTSVLLKHDDIATHEFGVGDEVAVVGLFRLHPGEGRNIPVLRVGNLAAIPDEPIHTKYCGEMNAYLIETHSIGGLSGSPVWVHSPPVRVKDDQMQIAKGTRTLLLGLMHGHFDLPNQSDEMVATTGIEGAINSGIGIVVPAYRILETLNHPTLVERRKVFLKDKWQDQRT